PTTSRRRRLELFAALGFLVVVCAPAVYNFHYYSHLVLLAGLIPGWVAAAREEQAAAEAPATPAGFGARKLEVVLPVLFLALTLTAAAAKLKAGVPDAINKDSRPRLAGLMQSGWNDMSEDHVWGKGTNAFVRLPVDKRGPASLTMTLGTFGREWVPPNPVVVSVNGVPRVRFAGMPGQFRTLELELPRNDLFIGCNLLEFESEWARSPSSFRAGGDTRALSVYWSGLKYAARPDLDKEPD
ncbi:hypothetical protein HZA57_05760, partial [Candidatus Poribacteria bacterium]|nr:hypothetical protein [Candidatus Poribacteria bacterium]